MFESASNSKININKSRVYGFGRWNWRVQWPIRGMKTEFDYFNALGVIFSTDYDKALHTTWKKIYEKIKKGLAAMTGRYMNIFQKALLINATIASKIWYTSHVYPLPIEYVKQINKEVFKFIWNSPVDPIKRDVLYNSKDKGGINLLNIHVKSKCIFANTVLRSFLNSDDNCLSKYYLTAKMNKILGVRNIQPNRVLPPYYEYALDVLKKCTNINGFPNINSKKIYHVLKLDGISNVEVKYPGYDWLNIWKCINFKWVNMNDRPIIYKYVHEVIPTNKRLYQIRCRNNPICDSCDQEDSIKHKFYECIVVQDCLCWVRRLIVYLCGINTNQESLSQFMSFDIPKVNIKVKNTLIVIISSYVACIWYNRNRLESIYYILKAKIIRDQKLNRKILGRKMYKIFTDNYCKENIEFINRL